MLYQYAEKPTEPNSQVLFLFKQKLPGTWHRMAKETVLIVAMLRGQDLEALQLSGNLVTTCTNCRNIQVSPNFVHTLYVSYESHKKT